MNQRIKKIFILFILTGFSLQGGWKNGKYSGAFLMNPVGSRAASMGGAFTSVANDVSTVYWNPAGLAFNTSAQITGMHSERFSGMVNLDFIAAALNIREKTAIGIGYIRLGVDGIPQTRLINANQTLSAENRPYIERYLEDSESAFFFSYGSSLNSRIYWGTSIKILYKSMGDYQAWGLGFDGGLVYLPTQKLRLGMMLSDATTTMLAWQSGVKEYIMPQLKLGCSYVFSYEQLNVMPAFDIATLFYRDPDASVHLGNWSPHFHAGVELDYMRRVALRVGSFRGQLTVGAGLRIAFIWADYCFSRHDGLGDSHLISLTFRKKRTDRP